MATVAGFTAPLDARACSAKSDCHSEPHNYQDKNVRSSGAASASLRSHNPINLSKLQTGLARPDSAGEARISFKILRERRERDRIREFALPSRLPLCLR